jgi:ABC-type nitrate/sulfonate/bicarbonate transport system permease component
MSAAATRADTRTRARGRTARARRRSAVPLIGLLPVVLGLALWQLLGADRSPVWPRPSTWFEALAALADRGVLLPAIGQTSVLFVASLVLCTILGLVVGLVVGSSRLARRATGPAMSFTRSIPPPALIPLAVLLIPNPVVMTICVVTFAAMWPIVLAVSSAYAAIPPIRIESGRMLQFGRGALFGRFIIPSLVPDLFLGIRIAAPIALVVTLATEFLGSGNGIGRLLILAQSGLNAAAVFGLIFVIALMGVILNQLLALLETALLYNRPPGGSR